MGWTRKLQDAWDWAAENFFYVAAAVCIFGFAAAALSIPLGFGFVEFAGKLDYQRVPRALADFPPALTKEVGYVSALNWSLYGAIILPVIVVFCLRVRAAMKSTLVDLADNGMLRRRADFGRISAAEAVDRWQRVQQREIILVAVVSLLVMAFAVHDWWQVVGSPLLQTSPLPGRPLSDPVMEYDWSVSSLFSGSGVAVWPLLIFGLLVYLAIPGFGSALAFATFISALHFLSLVCGLVTPKSGPKWKLAAKPDPHDKLKGFSLFEPLFSNLVSAALAIVFGLWIMMVQNNYLRSVDADSIFAFLGAEGFKLSGMFSLALDEYPKKFFGWFSEGSLFFGRNPQVGIGLLVFAFVFTAILAACWGILRTSARTAGDWSIAHADKLAEEAKRTRNKIVKDLQGMTYWPIGWISLNGLLLLLVFLLAAVFSYRLGLLAALLVMLKALSAVPAMVRKRFPKLPV